MAYYSKAIQEEELKNKVREDWFSGYDNTEIPGKVDFYIGSGDTSFLWAEAKRGIKKNIYEQFVQLILTIGKDRRFNELDAPDYLGAFDAEKIGFVHYDSICDVFDENDFNWQVTPSDHKTKEFKYLYELVHDKLKKNVFVFDFERQGDSLKFFIRNHFSINGRKAARTNINKNNFTHIYRKWYKEVKSTLAVKWDDFKDLGIFDCDFFLADLMSENNRTIKEKLTVLLQDDRYQVNTTQLKGGTPLYSQVDFNDGQMAHHLFWQRYRRPPKEEYRDYILERRDRLRTPDVRKTHGAFFTPIQWVEKSQEYLASELGEDWQDEYYVWDCAAGTGNLLDGLTNKRNIWASTLEKSDVDTMVELVHSGANMFENHIFQFDFLNDNLFDYTTKEGEFKPSKVPHTLQEILSDPEKREKLIIYINPPYKEAADKTTVIGKGENMSGVAVNSWVYKQFASKWGIACRELFVQFLVRIYEQIPGCKIAEFSKLKILQAPNFEEFRKNFLAGLNRGFIVPASTFDNVKGKFPIGFFIWHTNDHRPFSELYAEVYDAKGEPMPKKRLFVELEAESINDWIIETRKRPANMDIGYMYAAGCDFQHSNYNYIVNDKSQLPHPRGTQITDANIREIAVYIAVRHCIDANWLNDRDQFRKPLPTWLDDTEFQSDSLIYMLFSLTNNTKCELGKNYFIPFSEEEIGLKSEMDSDFMYKYIKGNYTQKHQQTELYSAGYWPTTPIQFSAEAKEVLDAAKALWTYYHQQPNSQINATYYDIREHFQGRKSNGKMNSTSCDEEYNLLNKKLRKAHHILANKLIPKVYEHGFLLK